MQLLPAWGSGHPAELSHLLWGLSLSWGLHPFLALFIITQQRVHSQAPQPWSSQPQSQAANEGINEKKGEEPQQNQR